MKQRNKQFLPKPEAMIEIQSDAVKALIELNKSRGQGTLKSHPLVKQLAFKMIDIGYPKSVIAEQLGTSYSLVQKWDLKRQQIKTVIDEPAPELPKPVLVEAGTITVIQHKKTLFQMVMGWFR